MFWFHTAIKWEPSSDEEMAALKDFDKAILDRLELAMTQKMLFGKCYHKSSDGERDMLSQLLWDVLEDMAICVSKCASKGTGVSWVPDGVSLIHLSIKKNRV